MITIFYIVLNMKTPAGLESFGRFHIGNDRETAAHIFSQLKGNLQVDENITLCFELMETMNGLHLNIRMKSCSLQQLGENCVLITREVFKKASAS